MLSRNHVKFLSKNLLAAGIMVLAAFMPARGEVIYVTDNEGAAGTADKTIQVRSAEAYMRGDVNHDGMTNIFDLLSLLAILAGSEEDSY
jgi:hypothetical protein